MCRNITNIQLGGVIMATENILITGGDIYENILLNKFLKYENNLLKWYTETSSSLHYIYQQVEEYSQIDE